jgi:hypothetical protein
MRRWVSAYTTTVEFDQADACTHGDGEQKGTACEPTASLSMARLFDDNFGLTLLMAGMAMRLRGLQRSHRTALMI